MFDNEPRFIGAIEQLGEEFEAYTAEIKRSNDIEVLKLELKYLVMTDHNRRAQIDKFV